MQNFIDFFIEVGKLKEIPKKGWVLIGARHPESIVEHSFQVALMAWLLGEQKEIKFDIERVLKMSMIHDLCELYTGDETPYDKILPRNKEEWPELFDKWPRSTRSEKIRKQREKYQKELNAFRRLVSKLPPKIKQEISELWLEYEEMRTEEARFVKQVNRVQKLLQALVYGQEQKIPVYKSWWIGSKEKVDDPVLIKFMDELERKFYPKNPKNKK